MGCDLAICFSDVLLAPDDIAAVLRASPSGSAITYMVCGGAASKASWRSFFGLWADGSIDLQRLCESLSEAHSATLCLAWKSEHGGVAGYFIFRGGSKTDHAEDSGDDYLLLPAEGVERAFRAPLALSDEERLIFPEMVLKGNELAYALDGSTGKLSAAGGATVTQLLEDDLEVEPVLPVEL